ncbi:MAG: glutathione peroxidase [Candidatus Cloacimonetes bacterium 4572_65]|nr:MAG: glutathione peroxidase [Candidatus Cloacimonetes bacterium 4572_65]
MRNSNKPNVETFYQFKALAINGDEISMNEYKGKVILVVNSASKCAFTDQYEGLQKLYLKHKDSGFVILGFPSNQFANQEPSSNDEINSFCTLNYGVDFPMFGKIDVNGADEHPLYSYLKEAKPGFMGKSIKWNFTKFLINRRGEVVQRFAPTTKPFKLEGEIINLLKERR